jgi:hypothetical protein
MEETMDTGRFHGFVTTPSTIGFVDAMLAAVLAAIVVAQMQMPIVPAAAVGVLAFLVTAVILAIVGYRSQAMASLAAALPRRSKDSAAD